MNNNLINQCLRGKGPLGHENSLDTAQQLQGSLSRENGVRDREMRLKSDEIAQTVGYLLPH